MSMLADTQPALTDGQLPLEPFRHTGPTAIGLVDLDLSPVPAMPAGRGDGGGFRDALVVVRLHGEPLGIVYLDRPLREVSAAELREAVWSRLEGAMRRHVAEAGCLPQPERAADVMQPGDGETECRFNEAAQPPGSVAVIVPSKYLPKYSTPSVAPATEHSLILMSPST